MPKELQGVTPAEYVDWLWAQVDGKGIPSTPRVRAAAACLQLAMEHHQSIVILTEQKLFGSAFALLRSAYEAYVRGEWLHHCAPEEQIQKFLEGKGAPKMDRMIAALEKDDGFEDSVLSAVKRFHWKTMSEYTHSGALHLQRRQSEEAVESNYSDREVDEVVELAEIFGSVAALDILNMAEDLETAEMVYNVMKARAE